MSCLWRDYTTRFNHIRFMNCNLKWYVYVDVAKYKFLSGMFTAA